MIEIAALELELKAHQMVEGTQLNWKEVIRFKDTQLPIRLRVASYEEDSIEIAEGIVDGKPIWRKK